MYADWVCSVRRRMAALGLAAVLTMSGCGVKTRTNAVPVFPVRGTVLFNGQPLADAVVFFHPLEDAVGAPRPHARTASDGAFQISTYRLNDGAPAGTYRVAISCKGPYDGKSEDRDEDAKEILPPNYLQPATSGITVLVEPRDNDLAPFDLRGDGRS